jgi:hypothetical protein
MDLLGWPWERSSLVFRCLSSWKFEERRILRYSGGEVFSAPAALLRKSSPLTWTDSRSDQAQIALVRLSPGKICA